MKKTWQYKSTVLGQAAILTIALGMVGCGSSAPTSVVSNLADVVGDDTGTNAEPAAKGFGSAGGTSDLSLGSTDSGTAILTSFDPGAFVQTGATTEATSDGDIGTAEDMPPPDDGGTTAPPPDDGGTTDTPAG